MNDSPQPSSLRSKTWLADSPLVWVIVFGLMALLAVLAIERKHLDRQERLARMNVARDGVLVRKVDPTASPVPIDSEELRERSSLAPLVATLWVIVVLAIIALRVRRLWLNASQAKRLESKRAS